MDNRVAWDTAARKYVEESDQLLAQWVKESPFMTPGEIAILEPLLEARPTVVHLQSGNGIDALDLCQLGARSVFCVDFSVTTVTAAANRAHRVSAPVEHIVAEATQTPLRSGFADIIYTGKGALMWLADLASWASEVQRLLRPDGWLFIYEAHPIAPLWTHDPVVPGVRADLNYFGGQRHNDTFPASAIHRFGGDNAPPATEFQWPLAVIITAILDSGMSLRHVAEYPEPFWRPGNSPDAVAWQGRLPNSFSLIAQAQSAASRSR